MSDPQWVGTNREGKKTPSFQQAQRFLKWLLLIGHVPHSAAPADASKRNPLTASPMCSLLFAQL